MNKADPLMAMLRQIAVAKTASRTGPPNVAVAKENKDSKDKVDHFREQLRLIAQGTKPEAKAETSQTGPDLAPLPEHPHRAAEIPDEAPIRSKVRSGKSGDPSKKGADDATVSPLEWRSPEASLSAVISRFDQAQTLSRGDDSTTRVAHPQIRSEQQDVLSNPVDSLPDLKSSAAPDQRFTVSVAAAETRTAPPVKVAVREQETHFEPVQQLTQLQKIVGRMVTDLPPASAQTGSAAANVALPDPHKVQDRPVRILTLQLDPPDLGAVTVKMRLTGNAVEIHLSADRSETAQMLRDERGALSDVMQSAGYAFDIASIDQSAAGNANPGGGQPPAQSEHGLPQQQHSGSQTDSSASQRQSGDAQGGARQNRQQHDQFAKPVERAQDHKPMADRNGGALYL